MNLSFKEIPWHYLPLMPVDKCFIVYGVGCFCMGKMKLGGLKVLGNHFFFGPFTHYCDDLPEHTDWLDAWEKVKAHLTADKEPDLWSIKRYPHLFPQFKHLINETEISH